MQSGLSTSARPIGIARYVSRERSVWEQMLEVLDWAPKVGFSAFFMQFPDGYAFFDRWMTHQGNTLRESEPISSTATRAWTIRLEQEVHKRGLISRGVGRRVDGPAGRWDGAVPLESGFTPRSPPEQHDMLAEVKGVRALCRGIVHAHRPTARPP